MCGFPVFFSETLLYVKSLTQSACINQTVKKSSSDRRLEFQAVAAVHTTLWAARGSGGEG